MMVTQRALDRRRVILDAARSCFLQFGFAKTSLDDIAKRANLSRPLLYRTFKNKEDIYGAVYDDLYVSRYPHASRALAGRSSKRDKLQRVCEIVIVEPWQEVMNGPMAREFYDACSRVAPEVLAKHQKKLAELVRELLGSRDLTEVFLCAIEGLMMDVPPPAVLRKRVGVLVGKFAA